MSATAFTLAINQQFHVTGPGPGVQNLVLNGSPGLPDALIVNATPSNQFLVVSKGNAVNSGSVTLFTAAVQRRLIAYSNVAVVSPKVAGSGNLLVMGPDLNEPNDFLTTATFLGSGATLQIQHATITPQNTPITGLPADNDYYRVVAQQTGTLDFQVFFQIFSTTLLPAGGNLNLQVLDAAGNVIATASGGAAAFGAVGATGNARIRIPVVAGQSYFLRVFGAKPDGTPYPAVVNGYDATVINTPPPAPLNLELSRSVPAGVAGSPDTGDLPPGAPNDDTGRSQFDNVTNINTPTIYVQVDDAIFLNDLPGNGSTNSPPAGVIPIPFQGPGATPAPGYRVAIFDGNNTQNPIGFATQVAGFPGLYAFTFTSPLAPDGIYQITAKVQMVDPSVPQNIGFGDPSPSLDLAIDTVPPPVFFGTTTNGGNGLDAGSDTGIAGAATDAATLSDRITSDTYPTFYGTAEADAIIRVYAVSNLTTLANGSANPNFNLPVLIGQTVANPTDGTNAFSNGSWSVPSDISLDDASLFSFDGTRTIEVTAEDLAGNVSAVQTMLVFIDTQGPQISNVQITGSPTYDLFGVKGPNGGNPPSSDLAQGPTPLVNSLTISVVDDPARDAVNFGGDVAIASDLAAQPGTYTVQGVNIGIVTITQVVVTNNPLVNGQPATATIELVFAKPLPNDTYTLTINHSNVVDLAGNGLAGLSNANEPIGTPTFPSGPPAGDFVARFTVNSFPVIGVSCNGVQDIDINGNGVNNPGNASTDDDLVFNFGTQTDIVFAGDFVSPGATSTNGFDKLGAYGEVNGVQRWLLDLVGDGVATYSVTSGLQIPGYPVAGKFNPNLPGDQIALFNGQGTWYIDMAGQDNITSSSLVYHDDLTGYPIVGDFDGSGNISLATYRPDLREFFFDLDPFAGGPHYATISFGVGSVNARPVAADFNRDGVTDIGLFVPDGSTTTPSDTADWYILQSTGTPTAGTVNTLNHPFDPTPLGNDLFFQFGNNLAYPIVGTFDPPPADAASNPITADISAAYQFFLGRNADPAGLQNATNALQSGASYDQIVASLLGSQEYFANHGSTNAGFIQGLYQDLLDRSPNSSEVAGWLALLNSSASRTSIAEAFVNSGEFGTTMATSNYWQDRLANDNFNYVASLYQNLLDRTGSQSEVQVWVDAITNSNLSRSQVVSAFLNSTERRIQVITADYQQELGRTPDQAGLNSWLNFLANGGSVDALADDILAYV